MDSRTLSGPEGHPFHALLVPLPIGAFVSSFPVETRVIPFIKAALNKLGPRINAFKALEHRAGVAGYIRLDPISVRQEVKAILSRRQEDGKPAAPSPR